MYDNWTINLLLEQTESSRFQSNSIQIREALVYNNGVIIIRKWDLYSYNHCPFVKDCEDFWAKHSHENLWRILGFNESLM